MAKKKPPVTFERDESRKCGLLEVGPLALQKEAAWFADDFVNLLVLCRHYGIPEGPDQWYALALELARELYPTPKKRGSPTRWTPSRAGILVVEIDRLVAKDDPKRGPEWAAKELVKRDPWRSFMKNRSEPAELLRKVYFKYRRSPVSDVWRQYRAALTKEQADEKWGKVVADAFKGR